MENATDQGRSLLMLASIMAPRVQVEGIRLSHCRAMSTQPAPEGALQIEYGFNGEAKADREHNRIAVVASLMVCANRTEGSEVPVLRLEADFHLEYKIDSFDGISDEAMDAFGKINGIYNAWPYCREYVQSMVGRMGFPALVLPVLTGQAIQQMYELKAAKDTEAKMRSDASPEQPKGEAASSA
jgi:preprotein translocase subunit SecB